MRAPIFDPKRPLTAQEIPSPTYTGDPRAAPQIAPAMGPRAVAALVSRLKF